MTGKLPVPITRQHSQEGQTLVTVTLFFGILIALAGVLVDGGTWMVERRDMQGVADSAALAGVRELPRGEAMARFVAEDYIEGKNAADDASVQSISVDGNRLTAVAHREVPGMFTGLFGIETPDISATATAEFSQVGALERMLPLALMRDSYTIGENTEIKTAANNTGNRGAIAPHGGTSTCEKSAGANDFEAFILTSEYGGTDACSVLPGETVMTETGNMAGKARSGFNRRIGSNSQSFDDVFEIDPQMPDHYYVKDVDSPRLGIVPIIENTDGTTNWPGGSKPVKIVGYVLVYIGHTGEPGNPPYTNNGKEVWVTPLKTILPEDMNADYSQQFNNALDAPVSFRLVE